MKVRLSKHELYNINNGKRVVIIDTSIMYVTVYLETSCELSHYVVQCIFNTNEVMLHTRRTRNYNMSYADELDMDELTDGETLYNVIYQCIHTCELDIAKQLEFVNYMYEHNMFDCDLNLHNKSDGLENKLITYLEDIYCHNLLEKCYNVLNDVVEEEDY